MNKPLVYIFHGRLVVVWCLYWCFLAFSSTISQVFTIFYDCLICKCCTFSPLFYFPNLVKTDLLYIHLQNYMRRDDLVLLEGISNSVPQFTSGSCNCGNHSVAVFSFTTTQRNFKKNTLSKGTPYILFQPLHLHFYLLAWYLGKFYTGFSSRCNPWEW